MNFKLRGAETLFLLIDVQESLFNAVQNKREVETNIKLLLRLANIIKIPLGVTTQNGGKLGPTIDSLKQLLPLNQSIYDKMVFSCLKVDGIRTLIRSSRPKTVVLFGIEAHICVFQTAQQLLDEGFQVVAVTDAVSSRTEANRETGLNRLREIGAILYSTEMVIYEILGQAGTPEFKSILPFLKALAD